MAKVQTLRKVPWTCRWGQFGGPVNPADMAIPGFVFWMCAYPAEASPRPLARGSCEVCPNWEPDDRRDS